MNVNRQIRRDVSRDGTISNILINYDTGKRTSIVCIIQPHHGNQGRCNVFVKYVYAHELEICCCSRRMESEWFMRVSVRVREMAQPDMHASTDSDLMHDQSIRVWLYYVISHCNESNSITNYSCEILRKATDPKGGDHSSQNTSTHPVAPHYLRQDV